MGFLRLHSGIRLGVIACAWVASSMASAETSGVSPTGFLSTHRHEVKATPSQLVEAVGKIDRWWSPEHSYSGRASNLHLELKAGGCFCERWDEGSVQHAQVVYVDRKAGTVRLIGGLGPLQPRAVEAVLTFAAAASEGKTVLTVTYRVNGPADVGLEKLAGPVDQVIGEAATRLAAFIESGKP